MISNCKMGKDIINTPDVPPCKTKRTSESLAKLPTIKYIVVTKVHESEKPFKMWGAKCSRKIYGIGILTTKNHYYYSELHTRRKDLTAWNTAIFNSVLLSKYIINSETKILVEDNLKEHTDPIMLYLRIATQALKSTIYRKSHVGMVLRVNDFFKYVSKRKKSTKKITKWHRRRIIDSLFEHDRFDFITDPDWSTRVRSQNSYTNQSQIHCAIGILYMYSKEYRTNINHIVAERHRKEKLMEMARAELSGSIDVNANPYGTEKKRKKRQYRRKKPVSYIVPEYEGVEVEICT